MIADIGGYTEYMQSHRTILGHAEAATSRLLKKVVDAARGFDLIEIEGDAAFLSREADALNDGAMLDSITGAVVAMHRAFHVERRLVELNLCPCESCTQTSELKLKFVAQVGEVAIQKIKRRRKLVGMAVIFVHRLLKNPVPVPEYVLLSEDLYQSGGTSPPDDLMHEISQDLEGIGPVRTYFVKVGDLAGPLAPVPDPSGLRRVGETVAILGRGRRERRGRSLNSCRAAQSASLAAGRRSASALSLAVTTCWPAAALAGYPVTAVRYALRCKTLTPRCASAGARMVAVRGWSRNSAISPKQSPRPSVLTTRPSWTTSARPDSTT